MAAAATVAAATASAATAAAATAATATAAAATAAAATVAAATAAAATAAAATAAAALDYCCEVRGDCACTHVHDTCTTRARRSKLFAHVACGWRAPCRARVVHEFLTRSV